MAEASPWIAIVDDDPAVLRALSRLLRSHAFRARTYGSGREFLAALQADVPDCLIVDLQMPEMNGLELHQHLVSNGITIPTILITAHADVALRDQGAMVASLRKPLQEQALFDAIDKAAPARAAPDRGNCCRHAFHLTDEQRRSAGMPISISMIIVSSQLVVTVADGVPAFDIDRSCKLDVAATAGLSIEESLKSCVSDEKRARQKLTSQWSKFSAAGKAECVPQESIGGTPSYVSLLTCLQMGQWSR